VTHGSMDSTKWKRPSAIFSTTMALRALRSASMVMRRSRQGNPWWRQGIADGRAVDGAGAADRVGHELHGVIAEHGHGSGVRPAYRAL